MIELGAVRLCGEKHAKFTCAGGPCSPDSSSPLEPCLGGSFRRLSIFFTHPSPILSHETQERHFPWHVPWRVYQRRERVGQLMSSGSVCERTKPRDKVPSFSERVTATRFIPTLTKRPATGRSTRPEHPRRKPRPGADGDPLLPHPASYISEPRKRPQ